MGDLTGMTFGRYQILERVGRGGMAEVYKAYQPSLDRHVAIKVLHPFLLEEAGSGERFQREARAVAALRHPHILQVFDFDEQNGTYFMVMEYIGGPNLKAVLQQQIEHQALLPLERVGAIITGVGGALDYAHQQDMVHRDVKPHNIMFTEQGHPLLTDFGIAKIVSGASLTASGVLSGTPAYMSPEQGRGERLDARTDIYSLGVVLYEMVTGRVPFDADTPFAVVIKHINDPLPHPRTINPALSPAVEGVVLRALAKAPDERYQTAGEMVRALQTVLATPASMLPASARVEPNATSVPGLPTTTIPIVETAKLVDQESPAQHAIPTSLPASMTADTSVAADSAPAVAPTIKRATRRWPIMAGAVVVLLLIGAALVALQSGNPNTTTQTPTTSPAAGAQAGQTSPLATTAPAMSEGDRLLAAQQYEQALTAFQATLQQDPVNPAALSGRGQALLGLQRYPEAIDALTQALAIRPDDPGALLARADANAALGAWSEAGEDAGRVLEQDKTSLPALMLHGRASYMNGDAATAERDLSAAFAAHPDDPEIYRARAEMYRDQGKIPAAIADLQQATTLDDQDASLWVALGETFVTYSEDYEQQPDRAIEAFTRALLLDPKNATAYYERGRVYGGFKSDEARAKADLTLAITIGPATADMYYERAQQAEDEQSRRADLDQAIAVNPQDPKPYIWRADYLTRQRAYADGVKDYTSAIELEPENGHLYVLRSHLYVLLADYAAAEADTKRALETSSDSADPHLAQVRLFFVQGNYDAALVAAQAALDVAADYNREDCLAARARVYVRLNRLDEATADFEKLTKSQTSEDIFKVVSLSDEGLLGLSELAITRKAYDEALTLLDQWANNGPGNGGGYVLRAQVYLAQNQPDKARADIGLARTLILYPDEVKAAEGLQQQIGGS